MYLEACNDVLHVFSACILIFGGSRNAAGRQKDLRKHMMGLEFRLSLHGHAKNTDKTDRACFFLAAKHGCAQGGAGCCEQGFAS